MADQVGEVISTNDRAETLLGRRRTDAVPFDMPCELGYWCPVCKVPPLIDGEFDERLHWSEYNGFLWCEVCNKDYPSALCVPLDAEKHPERPWMYAGVEGAIEVFLNQIEAAQSRQSSSSEVGAVGRRQTSGRRSSQ